MPSLTDRMRLPGACARCNRYLREVKETHADGPLAGTAKTFGELWNDGVRVVSLLMLDGAWTTVMLCAECRTEPEDLRAIQRKLVELGVFQLQGKHRRAAGAGSPDYTPAQLETQRRALAHQANNPFIGVLDEYPLEALLERTHVLPARLS